MKIIIGGDFCITPEFLETKILDSSIIGLFQGADYNIVNLECPVTTDDKSNKILKSGPHLRTEERIFSTLKELNIKAVTLANNHILDYNEKGMFDTMALCRSNGIDWVGAGENLKNASQPLIINRDLNIGVINICENEWSIAKENKGGANPIDIIDNVKQIKKLKERVDSVIMIVHGGIEYYNLPSPIQKKIFSFFAESGADIIVGHHSHCLSGYGYYKHTHIFYGIGNLLFTLRSEKEKWYYGSVIELEITKNEPTTIKIHAIEQSKENFKLSLASNSKKKQIINEIEQYSSIIQNEDELTKHWLNFVKSKGKTLQVFSPLNSIKNKFVRRGFKLLFNKLMLNKEYLSRIHYNKRCQSHNEILDFWLNEVTKAN
ncbi:MAG: CapA family protein [bacterium]